MKQFFTLMLVLTLFGCSNSSSGGGSPKGDDPAEKTCPSALPINKEIYHIHFSGAPVPKKVQIFYNGTELYNSCTQEQAQDGVVSTVSINEASSSGPQMTVKILHLNNEKALPVKADLDFVDLKDCLLAPESFVYVENFALNFQNQHIGPEACNILEKVSQAAFLVE